MFVHCVYVRLFTTSMNMLCMLSISVVGVFSCRPWSPEEDALLMQLQVSAHSCDHKHVCVCVCVCVRAVCVPCACRVRAVCVPCAYYECMCVCMW